MFFVSAWLLVIFSGIVSADVGIRPFGYVTSMVVTIGLRLTLLFMEPGSLDMERKMLLGIKHRAEETARQAAR